MKINDKKFLFLTNRKHLPQFLRRLIRQNVGLKIASDFESLYEMNHMNGCNCQHIGRYSFDVMVDAYYDDDDFYIHFDYNCSNFH